MTPSKVTLNHLVKSFSMTFLKHDESCSEYAQNLRKLDEKCNKKNYTLCQYPGGRILVAYKMIGATLCAIA